MSASRPIGFHLGYGPTGLASVNRCGLDEVRLLNKFVPRPLLCAGRRSNLKTCDPTGSTGRGRRWGVFGSWIRSVWDCEREAFPRRCCLGRSSFTRRPPPEWRPTFCSRPPAPRHPHRGDQGQVRQFGVPIFSELYLRLLRRSRRLRYGSYVGSLGDQLRGYFSRSGCRLCLRLDLCLVRRFARCLA
jgi:hypothetical protein